MTRGRSKRPYIELTDTRRDGTSCGGSSSEALPLPELAEVGGALPETIRKAVDYADDHNLAGVVVCGSLYLAADARPLLLEEAQH